MRIEDFTMNYKKSTNQKNLFTSSHVRYDVTIGYNDREITIEFQCNPTFTKIKLNDILDCVISDAYAYWNNESPFEFMEEFGYEDIKQARKIYNGCKDNFEKLCYLLDGEDGIEELNSLLEN